MIVIWTKLGAFFNLDRGVIDFLVRVIMVQIGKSCTFLAQKEEIKGRGGRIPISIRGTLLPVI